MFKIKLKFEKLRGREMSKKKICHISTAHSEIDGRILYKECTSLSKAGYDVSYIVSGNEEKYINGVRIVPLGIYRNRFERMNKQKKAYKSAIDIDADIYQFHDPELIGVGRKLKKLGKKVIYDSHEDTPKQILAKSYLGFVWMRKMISRAFAIYEAKNSKTFDAIITPQVTRLNYFKNINSNTTRIENYALRNKCDKEEAIDRTEEEQDKVIIIYVGSITKIRGIREMINSLMEFDGKVNLWLLGPWEDDEIRNECEALEGFKYTKYLGVVPGDEVYKYVKCADVGMSVLYPTKNYKEAIPTKVFDYMACGKPVILSDFKIWKELFGDVGVYINPNSKEELISAIKKYVDNVNLAKEQGKKNRSVFVEKFSWEQQEETFLNIYRGLLEKDKK